MRKKKGLSLFKHWKSKRRIPFDSSLEMYNVHMHDPTFNLGIDGNKDVVLLAKSIRDAISQARGKAMGIIAMGNGNPNQVRKWKFSARKED